MDQPPTYLNMVPVEIWAACWMFCTARQLRRISLVCHLFRSISFPLLLQHQTFDIAVLVAGIDRNNWMDRARHLHRTAVRLDRLSASPFLPLVRSWAVTFRPTTWFSGRSGIMHIGLFDAIHERVYRTFYTTLNLYRNLEALQINGPSKIDAAVWEILLSFPKLEDLHLRNCELGARNVGSGATAEVAQQIRSPTMLRSIDLDHSSLFLNGFSGRRLEHLTHLVIRCMGDVEPFFRFIEQCPRLESLTVTILFGTLRPRKATPTPPHPTSLPHLRSLTGPAMFIRVLAPNRPISQAVIVNETPQKRLTMDDLMLTCGDLCCSSVPIHSLAFPRTSPTIDREFLNHIVHMFPHTRELSLDIENSSRVAVTPRIRCGRGLGSSHRRPDSEVDTRPPELCDAEAFDSIPAEELSDDEAEDRPPILVSEGFGYTTSVEDSGTYSLEVVLEWIACDSFSLPLDLEILRLQAYVRDPELELSKQHRALALLSARWHRLCEVQLGLPKCTWRRTGTLWKSDDKSPVRIVAHTDGAEPTSFPSKTKEMASSRLD